MFEEEEVGWRFTEAAVVGEEFRGGAKRNLGGKEGGAAPGSACRFA